MFWHASLIFIYWLLDTQFVILKYLLLLFYKRKFVHDDHQSQNNRKHVSLFIIVDFQLMILTC